MFLFFKNIIYSYFPNTSLYTTTKPTTKNALHKTQTPSHKHTAHAHTRAHECMFGSSSSSSSRSF